MTKQYQLVINGQPVLIWTYTDGPFTKEAVPEAPGFYFLAGPDGNNAVGHAFTDTRSIWEEYICDFMVTQLNSINPSKEGA